MQLKKPVGSWKVYPVSLRPAEAVAKLLTDDSVGPRLFRSDLVLRAIQRPLQPFGAGRKPKSDNTIPGRQHKLRRSARSRVVVNAQIVNLANRAGKICKAGLVNPEQLLGRRGMASG